MTGANVVCRGVAVTIVCTDLERSEHFYEQVLGAVREQWDGYGCPWFRLGSFRITLMANATTPTPATFPDHPMAMLWLETDDLAAAGRAFARAGVAVIEPSDGRHVMIADPDGLLIEVWQAPLGAG